MILSTRAVHLLALPLLLGACVLNPLLSEETHDQRPYDADNDGLDHFGEDCDDLDSASTDPVAYFVDGDGDGFGDPSRSGTYCPDQQPDGYVQSAEDCDDADPTRYPGAPEGERCQDGLANDCDSAGDLSAAEAACVSASVDGGQGALGDLVDAGWALRLDGGDGERLGAAVAVAHGRLVLGAPGAGLAGAGQLELYSFTRASDYERDSDGEITVETWAGGDGDAAGTALASLADLDGDGRAELLFGVPEHEGGYAALVLSEPYESIRGSELEAIANGDPTHKATSSEEGAQLGASVAAGDLCAEPGEDAAPVVEVLAGAPGASGGFGAVIASGSGGECQRIVGHSFSAGSVVYDARIGGALAVGDIDGDGVEDGVVGGTLSSSGSVSVAAWPVLGPLDCSAGCLIEDLAQDHAIIETLTEGASEALSLAVVDLNSDGADDLALGAPGARGGDGVVVVIGGASDLGEFGEDQFNLVGDAEEALGSALAVVPRLPDEAPGLAIGALGPSRLSEGRGAVYVLDPAPDDLPRDGTTYAYSDTMEWVAVYTDPSGGEAGEPIGSSLASGDLDGDGWPELVIGAPDAGSGAGSAWVVWGALE